MWFQATMRDNFAYVFNSKYSSSYSKSAMLMTYTGTKFQFKRYYMQTDKQPHKLQLLHEYLHSGHQMTKKLQVIRNDCRVLTTCHTQYTWDSSIYIFLFNRTTLQVFVTYLTGALYVHPLRFYKHQHDNWVCSKLFVACQRWWFDGDYCVHACTITKGAHIEHL